MAMLLIINLPSFLEHQQWWATSIIRGAARPVKGLPGFVL